MLLGSHPRPCPPSVVCLRACVCACVFVRILCARAHASVFSLYQRYCDVVCVCLSVVRLCVCMCVMVSARLGSRLGLFSLCFYMYVYSLSIYLSTHIFSLHTYVHEWLYVSTVCTQGRGRALPMYTATQEVLSYFSS